MPLFATDRVDRLPGGHRVKPGLKPPGNVKALPLLVNPQKRALENVFGKLVAVEEPPQVGKQRPLIAVHEGREGLIVVPLAKPMKQLLVGQQVVVGQVGVVSKAGYRGEHGNSPWPVLPARAG